MRTILLTISLMILFTAQAVGSLEGLEKLFKDGKFQAPSFRETIRTIKPEVFVTRTKVGGAGFVELVESEKKSILGEFIEFGDSEYVLDSALVASGWSLSSSSGPGDSGAISSLLEIVKTSDRESVKKQLPKYGTYYHLRAKNEGSEPFGYDLFLITARDLYTANSKVLVLKVYYSYY